MKVYPAKQSDKNIKNTARPLSGVEKITKAIAMLAAFVTIYYFFLKILFL